MWGRRVKIILGLGVFAAILAVAAFAAAVVLTPLPPPDNPTATELLDLDGQPFARLFVENRVEVPVVEMPAALLQAVVAIEDERFYSHHGVDLPGIARAAWRNLLARRVVEGGSTLTQQLVKNLYLTEDRTIRRKIKEAILTMKLEYLYSKQEILGMYWNTIYLGRGAYGVEVASQMYFGKSARDLTLAESALLAALPRSPEYYSPFNNLGAAISRRNLVLDKMVQHGDISPDEAAAARNGPLELAPTPKPRENIAPYFLHHVITELRERFPDVASNLYRGGYRIYTTLDRKAQQSAEEAVSAAAPPASPDSRGILQPQVALVALDSANGHIRALVGGRQSHVDRNRTLEPQQPGSAFKPFVYAAALETYRYTAVSTQLDAPAEFPGATPDAPWRPQNYGNQYTNEPAAMREALQRSLNVVTAHWMNSLKPEPVIDLARRAGIQSQLPRDLTIGLGSAAVSPLELTTAYAPFANGGFAVHPYSVLRITDASGSVLAQQRPVRTKALDPGIAFIMTDLLKSVLEPGGTAAGVTDKLAGRPVAGKSGTSDTSRDAWFVGYTPDLVAGVWVGDDANRASNLGGGSSAAPIWAEFISRISQGVPPRDWTPPDNVEQVTICSDSSLQPNPSCPTTREWFIKGTAPAKIDTQIHWDRLLPGLPRLPWSPSGLIPRLPNQRGRRSPR